MALHKMAEGTSTVTKKGHGISETLNCPICLQKVKESRYLPCLHTFCESCLQTYINSMTRVEQIPENFNCPVCRRMVDILEQGTQVSDWAKLFPTNSLVEYLNKAEKELSTKICGICEKDGKQTTATYRCCDCADSICEECKQLHNKFAQIKDHRIIGSDKDSPENIDVIPDYEEPCYKHKRKYVEVFCFDHESLCCSICFATEHHHCKNVEEIDKVQMKMKKEFVDYDITVLADISAKLDEYIVKKEENLSSLNAKKDQISENVSSKVEEIKTLVDKLHSQFSKAFELDHENNVIQTEQCIKDLKGFKTTLLNVIKIFKVFNEKGSKKQLFIAVAKHVQQLLDHFQRLQKYHTADVDKEYEHEVESMLKQIADGGKIKDIVVKSHPTEIVTHLSKLLPQVCILRKELPGVVPWIRELLNDNPTLTANQISEFSFDRLTAKNAVFLDEQTILVSFENAVKIFGIDGKVIKLVHFSNLKGKVYLQNGEYGDDFLMSQGSQFSKCTILKENEITSTPEIDFPEEVEGFCVCGDFIISATRSSVKIYKRGKKVSLVKTIEEIKGGEIGYIAKSWSGEKFAYVTGDAVVCCKADGSEMFRHRDENLKCPVGLSFDFQVNVYVCTKFLETKPEIKYRKNRMFIYEPFYEDVDENTYNMNPSFYQRKGYYRFETGGTTETGGGVIKVLKDGSTGRVFISDYHNACFIQFCSNGELFLVSDTNKCTLYELSQN